MGGSLSQFLHKAWYGGKVKLWYLLPFTYLYTFIFYLRREAYRIGLSEVKSVNAPVIVVGNITVGGTGKTPLVIALANYLKQEGYKPGIVSRGYGGNARIYPQLVNDSSQVTKVGDEPLLIFEQTGVPVVVDPIRPRGIDLLVADGVCDIIISDDGLQHYAMDRDIEIVLLDGERLLGNKQRLPAGPLRESPERVKDVDMLVLNGASDLDFLEQYGVEERGFEMGLSIMALKSLPHTSEATLPKPNTTVHAVAAIGNPERFFSSLKRLGFSIIPHAFDDHYHFKAKDLEFDDDYSIVMTEKDAVKCRRFKNEKLWYLPVAANLPRRFYNRLKCLLDS